MTLPLETHSADPVRLTMEDIEAHAASMEAQPWWALHLAERALPPCPTCGEKLDLLLDGASWCDICNARNDGSGA